MSIKSNNACCVVLPWTGNDIKLSEAIHAHYVWCVHSSCRWWCAASVNRSRQWNSTWRYDKANVLSVMTWRHRRVTYINWTILLIIMIPYTQTTICLLSNDVLSYWKLLHMMIQWLGFEREWAQRMAIIGARDDTPFLQRAIRQWQLMVEHINDCCGSWAVALWAWWSTDELSIDACGSTTPALAGVGTNWVYSEFLAAIYTNSFSRAPLVSRSGASRKWTL